MSNTLWNRDETGLSKHTSLTLTINHSSHWQFALYGFTHWDDRLRRVHHRAARQDLLEHDNCITTRMGTTARRAGPFAHVTVADLLKIDTPPFTTANTVINVTLFYQTSQKSWPGSPSYSVRLNSARCLSCSVSSVKKTKKPEQLNWSIF